MDRTINEIVTHAAPSAVCPRPVIEMRVSFVRDDALDDARWRQVRDAVGGQARIGYGCKAIDSLAPALPGDRPDAAEAAAAMLAVCLQRVYDRKFDGCFGESAADGADLGFSASGIAAPGIVAFDYLDPRFAALAGRVAFAIVAGALGTLGEPAEAIARAVGQGLERLTTWFESFRLRDTQRGVVLEARRRGIPVGRVDASMPVVVLGQGSRQKWLWRTTTSTTPHVAVIAATNKHVANELLRDAGLPVPEQRLVNDLDGALRAAARIGYPVVVKPARTDYGIAVMTSIADRPTLEIAFERARAHGAVLVEKHIDGDQHRLSVLGGRLATVARLRPAFVVGNGRDAIAELVRIARIERLGNEQLRDFPFPIDDETVRVLAQSGLTLESVPRAGQTVTMRTNANLSGGGRIELIAQVHPDNVMLAERAAATIGLDLAGIDLISLDVATSWRDNGAAICEINPNPGLVRGQGSPAMIIDYMVAEDGGRIPIALVVAPNDARARLAVDALAARLSGLGHRVALACDGRVTIGGIAATRTDLSRAVAARIAVSDRTASAAVVVLGAGDLLEGALPFDRCALAALIDDPAPGEAGTGVDSPIQAILRACAARVLVNPSADVLAAWVPG